ncbi:MAG TPA: hypothetical protein VG777_05960, partial [Thermoanaerobaculia bacterium]|nr:hypothetical protein [Thermoanaerobaculia bacterium]
MKRRFVWLSFAGAAVAAAVALAAENRTPLSGTWSVEPSGEPGMVQLEMRRRTATSSWSSGETIPVEALSGFSP